jgi:SAM-dependent methyltransferase
MGATKVLSHYSLERLVPDELTETDATGAETLELHLARYRFAAGFVDGGRVLDCACGVGYGTALLASAPRKPEFVLGVDVDPTAVEFAQQRYLSDSTRFQGGDGAKIEDELGFGTIVSLETIEHVREPQALLGNFVRLLKPGGKLIASVPTTPSVDVNPYHLHDFTEKSFRALGAGLGLVEVDAFAQEQPFDPWKIATGREARLDDMRKGIASYYLRHPEALTKRVWSTLVDGFRNKYLTVVWEKRA